MAFSNSYDTTNPGSAVSNREDLTSILSMLSPEDTPFTSSIEKTKATATYHEWTVDDLADVNTAGVIEGADVNSFSDKFANRARLGNYVMKQRRPWQVSDIQDAVSSVGPADTARAKIKAGKELMRDREAVFLGTQDRTAGDASTAAVTRGLGDWVDSAGPSDVPADYRTPAAAIHSSGTLTEALFDGITTALFRRSGNKQDNTLIADTALRAVVSGFANTSGSAGDYRRVNQNAGATLVNTVSVYEGDYGMIRIVNMNPDTAPDQTNFDTGYFYSPSMAACADLIPVGSKEFEDQGGGKRGEVSYVSGLVVKNPGAFGKITAVA